MENQPPDRGLASDAGFRPVLLIDGGLIALCFVTMQAFIPLAHLDLPAFISMIDFALALPMLIADLLSWHFIILTRGQDERAKRVRAWITHSYYAKYGAPARISSRFATFLFHQCQSLGPFLAIGGITSALWHVSWVVGTLLLVSSFISVFAFMGSISNRIPPLP